jgi:hypothetical protein
VNVFFSPPFEPAARGKNKPEKIPNDRIQAFFIVTFPARMDRWAGMFSVGG